MYFKSSAVLLFVLISSPMSVQGLRESELWIDADSAILDRLDQHEAVLDSLVTQLSGIKGRVEGHLEKRQKADGVAHVISARLRVQEAYRSLSHCGSDEFECNLLGIQCIHNLLVCDGEPDCRNGEDEHTNICRMPLNKGDVLRAVVPDNNCLGDPMPWHQIMVTTAEFTPGKPFKFMFDCYMPWNTPDVYNMYMPIGWFSHKFHFGRREIYLHYSSPFGGHSWSCVCWLGLGTTNIQKIMTCSMYIEVANVDRKRDPTCFPNMGYVKLNCSAEDYEDKTCFPDFPHLYHIKQN